MHHSPVPRRSKTSRKSRTTDISELRTAQHRLLGTHRHDAAEYGLRAVYRRELRPRRSLNHRDYTARTQPDLKLKTVVVSKSIYDKDGF